MTHNSLLHCHTTVQFLYIESYVNNVEVTVNTCTCTDVFTIITTKDQSGWMHNSYSPGKLRPQATPLDSFGLPLALCYSYPLFLQSNAYKVM